MLLIDCAVGSNNGGFGIPQRGIDPFEGRSASGSCAHPASATIPKQTRPSLTTSRRARIWILTLDKRLFHQTGIYEEVAEKLLESRNDRKPLIDRIHEIAKR